MVLSRLLVSIAFAVPAWSSVVYTSVGRMTCTSSSYTVYSGAFVGTQIHSDGNWPARHDQNAT